MIIVTKFITRSISFEPKIWAKLQKLKSGTRSGIINDILRKHLPEHLNGKETAWIDDDRVRAIFREELRRMSIQAQPPDEEKASEGSNAIEPDKVDGIMKSFMKRREE
jgi:uncharacterized protein (DUF2249 family)